MKLKQSTVSISNGSNSTYALLPKTEYIVISCVSGSVTVAGQLTRENESQFDEIAVVNLGTMEIVDTITATGLYAVDVASLDAVQFTATANSEIIIKEMN